MKPMLAIAFKDLKVALRDPANVFFSYSFPVIYAVFFSILFAGAGGKSVSMTLGYCDPAPTDMSKSFRHELAKTDGVTIQELSENDAREKIRNGKLPFALIIEKDFGKRGPGGGVKILSDPSQKMAAGMLQGMVMKASMVSYQSQMADPAKGLKYLMDASAEIDNSTDMNAEQKQDLKQMLGSMNKWFSSATFKSSSVSASSFMEGQPVEEVTSAKTDTPYKSFDLMFPSGVVWGLMATAMGFGAAMISERNSGTLSRILIAPVTRGNVLLGKALACFISCMLIATVTFAVGTIVFGLKINDPAALIFSMTSSGICFVGIASFVSVLGKTEQSATGLGWFIMTMAAMIGGGMMPLMFMPGWIQKFAVVSPVRWAIESMMGATWRGLGVTGIAFPCAVLIAIGVVMFTLGARLFKWNS